MAGKKKINKPFGNEHGQGLVEYSVLLAFIAAVVVAGLPPFGDQVFRLYTTIANSWPK